MTNLRWLIDISHIFQMLQIPICVGEFLVNRHQISGSPSVTAQCVILWHPWGPGICPAQGADLVRQRLAASLKLEREVVCGLLFFSRGVPNLYVHGRMHMITWTAVCIYIYTLVFLLIYKNEYSKNKCHTLKTPDISLKPGISHTLFKRGRFLGIQSCQPIPPLLQGAMSWMGTTSWRRGHRWIGGRFRGYSWSNHSIAESKHICQMGRYV